MTTQNKPVSGELKLRDFTDESASGHIETSHSLNLVPSGHAGVQVIEEKEPSNAPRPYEDKSPSERWTVPVDTLVNLIKSHGAKS